MNVSFSVAMLLQAVNNMGPGVQSAMRQVQNLKQQLNGLNQNITATVRVKKIEETVKQYREQAQIARSKAVEDGATGAAILAPVVKTVTDFAQAEDSFTNLKISAYDSSIPVTKMQEELKKASEEAKRLGDVTRFSTKEAYDGMTTLIKGGASLQDVYSGTGQAALYLAQAGKVPVENSADAMVKIANAYQLTGAQMKGVADMISRVDGASTASIGSLQEGFKYSAGAAAQLGQSINETAQALAVLNNRGLDGSTAGTNYADMLQRLIPQTKQQTAYMNKLGWLDSSGKSKFFDADTGKIKNMAEVLSIMRNSLRGMRADEQLKYLHKIFGEQGGRAAMALLQGGKGSWEEVGENIAKAIALDDRIAEQGKTLIGRFENMMGSLQNLSADSGSPIGSFVSERLDGVTDAINKTRQWSEANPQVVKGIMWIITSLGMLKITSMVFNLLKAGVLGAAGDVMTLFGWFGKLGIKLMGLKDGFQYFRAMGGGVFESLWQGARLAWPWLGKITGWVGKFGGQWTLTALRVAAGWLIAMGPIGWITLAIIGAIVAWKTNFLGFRDTVKKIYDSVMGWLEGIINKMLSLVGISKNVKNIQQDAASKGYITPGGVSDMLPDGGPLIPQGGGRSTVNVNQTNNVTVRNAQEAAEYTSGSLPDKYANSLDPSFVY